MAEIRDIDLAVATLLAKQKMQTLYWDYYEGRQPLIYTSKKLDEIFSTAINARFTQNWCAVVVDAIHDRLRLQRITIADDTEATNSLDELIKVSTLTLESRDVHLCALVTGEAYLLVWADDEGNPEAYYNDSRNVHLFYDADRPREKRFGCKWWIGDDGHRYLNLYYTDTIEYYRSLNLVRSIDPASGLFYNEVSSGKSFGDPRTERNPHGIVPIFHFRRSRRAVTSELQNIIEPQDAVNKLLSDMMIAAEFGAFPQRYIISEAGTSQFRNGPNLIWDIPGSDGEGQPTAVGQFDVTPLANYLDAIDRWINSIAIISRTPRHFFMQQGGAPSGEALIAMEAPLNDKAKEYIFGFTATWSEVAQFIGQLGNMGEIDDNAIVPIFDEPVTVQPYTQALIRKEAVAAGIPLMWQMEQEGYTEQELEGLDGARKEAQAEQQEMLAQSMTDAQRRFDQGGQDDE